MTGRIFDGSRSVGELIGETVVAEARGQAVSWSVWAGDDRSNGCLEWAAGEVKRQFAVEVRHVKLSDTAEAVTHVLAEKAAGKTERGSVDSIWFNGENFAAMKLEGLLLGPFPHRIPNYRWVDTNNLPTLTDFTFAVDGLEAPRGGTVSLSFCTIGLASAVDDCT